MKNISEIIDYRDSSTVNKVFETVNGNRVELPESGYEILSPTAQFTFTNDSETEDIVMTDFIEVMWQYLRT